MDQTLASLQLDVTRHINAYLSAMNERVVYGSNLVNQVKADATPSTAASP